MKTCSQTIKACGLKSTKQVADLNGITPRTVQLAYKSDWFRFRVLVCQAIDTLYGIHTAAVVDILADKPVDIGS